MIGFDYTERIAPSALKAAGCAVVSRYLSQPGWPKNLTASEASELRAADMPILLNYETNGTFMQGGSSAGKADAGSARAQAAALGAPASARIYYSADFDASSSQVAEVLDFLNGAAAADGKAQVGVYGGLAVVRAAIDAGFAGWQTVAWSNGQWDPRALMRQTGTEQTVGGVQVDVNEVMNLAALGTWGGPSSTPTPGGSTVGTIPASIGQTWPEIAGQFPANAQFADETALIWADGGARAAALYARQTRDAINVLAAKVSGASVDVAALAAQLGPLLHPTTDANALAAALLPHLPGNPDPVAFATQLATHIKVV